MRPAVRGHDVTDQAAIDRLLCELDGTPNKSRLGANAILGVSLACGPCGRGVAGVPLWRYLDPQRREPACRCRWST